MIRESGRALSQIIFFTNQSGLLFLIGDFGGQGEKTYPIGSLTSHLRKTSG